MLEISWEMMVFECPAEGETVTMENCRGCEHHVSSDYDSQIASVSGTVECSYGKEGDDDETHTHQD